ncbi:MAG: Spy/CpxP family protein refolding chaperone [Alphaproteobacteria bacterium]|nr:Spy/CpxP family protein refolding chaperone [Alphaproteobacteria bacterium]
MSRIRLLLSAVALASASSLTSPAQAQARFAMMEMMPMGSAGAPMQQVQMSPAMPNMPMSPPQSGGMPGGGQDQMRMGPMPQGQTSTAPQAPTSDAVAAMCQMMAMMQNMMRMGGMQSAPMPRQEMPGGAMAMPMMGGATAADPSQSAAMLEGRIAYLRTELRITETQAPAWEAFASSLRAGREHLDAARGALQGANAAADPMARLQAYESHLTARTEAVRMTRLAFNVLFAQLDDAQKRVATTTMLPFIGAF